MRIAARVPCALKGKALTAALSAVACVMFPHYVLAVVFGQVDTFHDGTTLQWQEGSSSPNPPTNIATGGPAGADDRYLQNISSGGLGAGSRMVMFNTTQWTGNYLAIGVDRISAQMANYGSTTLYMRIAIRGGSASTIYCSNSAVVLPPNGRWQPANFDLTPSAMTNVGGANTLDEVLSNVAEVRILSAIGGAAFVGDPTAGTLGVDNITARDIANQIVRITDLRFNSGVPRISFVTLAGRVYRVERKNAVTDPNWIPLSNATQVPGNGGVVDVDDTEPIVGERPMRFYRVVLLPP